MSNLLILAYPNIDPIAIQIGPLAIRWYSIAYLSGIIIGWRLMIFQSGFFQSTKITKEQIDDLLIWIVIGIIVGGRLGYVFFYNFESYIDSPIEIPKVWLGGMSFHGGLIGVSIAMILFSKINKLPLLRITDLVASVAPAGIGLGRIANFINGELWGRPTEVPWAMIFPTADKLPRHPSQLYEAIIEGLILLILLQILYRKETFANRSGLITGIFLTSYGICRIFIEFFREPDRHIGLLAEVITTGQLLSLPMIILGIYFIFNSMKINKFR